MNWENQNKDPWGNKNDSPDFDDLINLPVFLFKVNLNVALINEFTS